jgi:hopene-associated glycosyltransferase HpnB
VILRVVAIVPLFAWIYLLLLRGGFWRVATMPTVVLPNPGQPRKVVAVIAARDEAAAIGDTVNSILLQADGAIIQIIVVDDGSTDGTAQAARKAAGHIGAAARLTVITGAPPPPGWTGKLWAMSQGAEAAMALAPDYLLFTDADIHHDPDNVAALLARAESHALDLVSYMVELPVASRAEKFLIPAFVFFFLQLYPPSWIASPNSPTAAAAGGCMLMRPKALARIGGLRAIRSQLIDDCALARSVKAAGGSVWLAVTRTARSTRSYGSLSQIARMISRSAFNQLQHSYLLLALTMAALALTYVLPPWLLLAQDPLAVAFGAAAWALMTIAYAPTIRFYRLSPLWSLCLPAIALVYAGATMHSAWQYARRRGGNWKGRIQDLRL